MLQQWLKEEFEVEELQEWSDGGRVEKTPTSQVQAAKEDKGPPFSLLYLQSPGLLSPSAASTEPLSLVVLFP